MAAQTTTVEIDAALMERLRARDPGKDDRAVIEDLARISLGFQTLCAVQERSDAPDEEATAEAVRVVCDIRRGAA